MELVVDGYTAPNNTPGICTLAVSQTHCDLVGANTFHFKAKRGTYSRSFAIDLHQPSPTGPVYVDFRLYEHNNSNNPIKFYCDDSSHPAYPNSCAPMQHVYIEFNNIPMAYILVNSSQGATAANMMVEELYTGEIIQVEPYANGFSAPGGGHTVKPGGFSNFESQLASTSPNPFTETLDVFLGQPDAENIHLQMYNLSGQKVIDQQFAGGQEVYTLSTADLSTGFYLLRIEADGEVQTLKVVKSE